MNIIPNLQKMGFVNHNLCKFLELAMNKYMMIVCEIEDVPIRTVQVEWAIGLDKVGSLLLMHLSHFGHTTEVNACVK